MRQVTPGLRTSVLASSTPPLSEQVAEQLNAVKQLPHREVESVAAGLARLHAGVGVVSAEIAPEVTLGLLDEAYATLKGKVCRATLERVFVSLKQMRGTGHPRWWHQFSEVDSLSHPIRELFHQDPFTRRSFDKPRGYAGDAVMLDYIYGERPVPTETTMIGREIFDFTTNAPASQSVRARKAILAALIDDAAERVSMPKVVSIACGHLREAGESRAIQENRIGELVALDQDSDSLALIEQTYPSKRIKTMRASVKSILAGKVNFSDRDLVYAAGLYDYLGERAAVRLTRHMFTMLKSGGRVLVANFAPSLRDIGYMETYMGWKLIYRTPEEMDGLAAEIPSDEIGSQRVYWDEHRNIVFLELTRK